MREDGIGHDVCGAIFLLWGALSYAFLAESCPKTGKLKNLDVFNGIYMAQNKQEHWPMEITPVHGVNQSVFNIAQAYLWRLCIIAKFYSSMSSYISPS